jgi:DNA-binding transcriptional ArsR family regulator
MLDLLISAQILHSGSKRTRRNAISQIFQTCIHMRAMPTCRLTCKYLPAYYSGKQLLAYLLMAKIQDADLLFKALADPSRRKLLDVLHAHDGQTLNELCEHLDMTRQAVTQHIALLEAANLVATLRQGREKLHFLNPVPLQQIYERWIAKFEKPRLKALSDLKNRLEKPNG